MFFEMCIFKKIGDNVRLGKPWFCVFSDFYMQFWSFWPLLGNLICSLLLPNIKVGG